MTLWFLVDVVVGWLSQVGISGKHNFMGRCCWNCYWIKGNFGVLTRKKLSVNRLILSWTNCRHRAPQNISWSWDAIELNWWIFKLCKAFSLVAWLVWKSSSITMLENSRYLQIELKRNYPILIPLYSNLFVEQVWFLKNDEFGN